MSTRKIPLQGLTMSSVSVENCTERHWEVLNHICDFIPCPTSTWNEIFDINCISLLLGPLSHTSEDQMHSMHILLATIIKTLLLLAMEQWGLKWKGKMLRTNGKDILRELSTLEISPLINLIISRWVVTQGRWEEGCRRHQKEYKHVLVCHL